MKEPSVLRCGQWDPDVGPPWWETLMVWRTPLVNSCLPDTHCHSAPRPFWVCPVVLTEVSAVSPVVKPAGNETLLLCDTGIIIMYIYQALINALSAHMIHTDLNTIFYTHIEHSPTKTIYIRYYMETHTHARTHTHSDCSRNWVLMLAGVEILWEEEGFRVFTFITILFQVTSVGASCTSCS